MMQPPLDSWRSPLASDEAVQVTHVDAALAKVSCAKLGYFEDRWTEQLMRSSRPTPRSPLIHRGYYSRVAAIRTNVTRFLEQCPAGSGVQIVDLGSGFDTLYFWLRSNPRIWRDDLIFYEVDFPEVLSKKVSAITRKQALWPEIDVTSSEEILSEKMNASGTRDLHTKHLRYVSTDMRICPELASAMSEAGLKPNIPTLFLSECVLVYMQALHGNSIIEWAASTISEAPAAMVVYEQCNPDDRFGKVMVDNLMRRGCPLLSIHDFPSMDSQRERFLSRGWDQCAIADMNKVYDKYLDCKDVERIQRLELLDEFEEWHLIQAHYFVCVATKTSGLESGAWVHKVPMMVVEEEQEKAGPPPGDAA
mmetsp:Transcript_18037/g.38549  ORF Transcript_18037/g.38549 Transcript_18037/m.38549 type:complete len:363 (-) Transcript_18037:214-1302(-)